MLFVSYNDLQYVYIFLKGTCWLGLGRNLVHISNQNKKIFTLSPNLSVTPVLDDKEAKGTVKHKTNIIMIVTAIMILNALT